ncbi:MAG: extracellular solute-binding protein [Chloroflexi bacterium]|nr:extracellular solute-binding protein [Chloroflexota bacterium]
MKTAYVLAIILIVSSFVLACTPPAAPAPSSETRPGTEKAVSKAAWEQKWEATLAEARREGIVRIYTLWGPAVTVPASKAFRDKYGIDLEFANVGRGSALVPKVEAETRAGLNIVDAYGFGATTLITTAKPAGLLGPIEPMLILPEVLDAKQWTGDRFPFVDKDKNVIGMLLVIQRFIVYNTDLVKPGEITTYEDLLKPQYKGKIAMGDPSLTGSPNALFGHLALTLWNQQKASDFLRRLVIDQEAVVTQEHRMVTEWVARGKYTVGLAAETASQAEFMKLGAPITLAQQKEGHFIDVAGGGLSVPKKSPHPNATAVFVNWLLTKEGQTLFAPQGYGFPSLRKDVPTEGMPPLLLPQPGEKIFTLAEEEIIGRGQLIEVARKIIAESRR